jgi:phosphatidate phosphatase PAH1
LKVGGGQNEEKWKKKKKHVLQLLALINGYKEFSLALSILTKQNITWSWFSFVQFCDIENVANFSKIFPVFFLGKQQNISQKNTEYVQKFSNIFFFWL